MAMTQIENRPGFQLTMNSLYHAIIGIYEVLAHGYFETADYGWSCITVQVIPMQIWI